MIWLVAVALAGRTLPDATRQLSWRTLRAEHASVHYPVGEHRGVAVDAEPFAQQLAAVVDELWLKVGRGAGHYPRGRLHIVVLDHEDELDAYTLPHQDWIVVSANPGTQIPLTRGHGDQARDVLAHELGHIVAAKLATPVSEAASWGLETVLTVTGDPGSVSVVWPVEPDVPYALSEGLAEWFSEKAGVNTWTPARDRTLRAAVLADRMLDWDELLTGEIRPRRP